MGHSNRVFQRGRGGSTQQPYDADYKYAPSGVNPQSAEAPGSQISTLLDKKLIINLQIYFCPHYSFIY